MTGIAIVLYLNQTPAQPRERDYAYAGSFYAFAIWVGMGVAGIIRMLREYCKMQELPAAVLASVLCLFVPIQMAGQTWDDHDRSGRFVARDFGQNYLMTLQEKEIRLSIPMVITILSHCGTTRKRKASVQMPAPVT